MSRIFYPTSEKLRFLLESIHQREVALPDFQRDFVWDPRETEELIESICQNYPAGSLLRIKNSAGFFFAPREFAEAPTLNGHQPSYLILDGQQRLTSLYQAFYGRGSHRYYIDLQTLLNGEDLEDSVFYLRRPVGHQRYGSLENQAKSLVFPFELLFGGLGFEEWLDRVLEARGDAEANRKTLKSALRDLQRRWLKPVEDYEFPMVTLAEQTTAPAVCTIFETLNRTGVKLSVFDLLAARFWPEDVKLRDQWEKAQEEHAIIADFEIDPYYVLQAVAIFSASGAPSCKRKDVLAMDVAQVRDGWKPVIKGLAEALYMLREDCGVILKLRELHDAMDRAVLDTYGWTDIQPRCEFILDFDDDEDDTPGRANRRRKPWRYRWIDEIRDEVLGRLLELNAKRAREEQLAGAVATKSAKGSKRTLRAAEHGGLLKGM